MKQTLKLLNFVITLAGATMIFYAWGMYRLWHPGRPPQPFQSPSLLNPTIVADWQPWSNVTWTDRAVPKQPQTWFISAVLSAGIVMCLTSSVGHIAAETSNTKMLACYCVCLGFIVLLQSILALFLVFDVHWHDALPYDPTGELDTLQVFVNDHLRLCKNLAWSFMALEGQCIFLALRMLVDGDDSRESVNQDSTDSESALQEPLLRDRIDVNALQSCVATTLSEKQPRIRISNMADFNSMQNDVHSGGIQPVRTSTSPILSCSRSTLHELSGLMGALSIEKHKLLKGKAITSPSSSNDLPLRDNAEEGSSLSGISWADLFVDAGDEDYEPACAEDDGSQDNEFQV